MGSFQFLRAGDRQPELIAIVDTELCIISGVDCHETDCCRLFERVKNIGLYANWRGPATIETLDAALENFYGDAETAEQRKFLRKVCQEFLLGERYLFDCWR